MTGSSNTSDQNAAFRKYVVLLSITILPIALTLFAVNLVIDPYGLLQLFKIQDLNTVKPRMYNNARMLKAHQVASTQPKSLVIGSSRSDVGLNPQVAERLGFGIPSFNSSIPSARIREVSAYVQHAHNEGDLNEVVVGLDFFMFDANKPFEPGFELGRLSLENNDLVWLNRAKDYLRAFFSYDALDATIHTVLNEDQYAVDYLDNGTQDPHFRQENVSKKGGHRAAFKAALRETVISRDAIADMKYASSSIAQNSELAELSGLLHFCKSRSIDVYLVISPVHALWLEAIWELGLWPDYERWKRDLIEMVESYNNTGDKSEIALWDFTGYSDINKEGVPREGNNTDEMHWYWEASHYKQSTGNLIFHRIRGVNMESMPENFGVQLNNKNIRRHLDSLREGRSNYFEYNQSNMPLLWEALNSARDQIDDNRG